MQAFIPDFLKLYFITICSVFTLLIIGDFILQKYFSSSRISAFASLFTANIIYVLIYSVIKTRGTTTLIGVIVLLIAYYLIFQRGKNYHKYSIKISPSMWVTLFVVTTIIFIANYLCIYNPFEHKIYLIGGDYSHYSRMAFALQKFGVETPKLNWFAASSEFPTLYHFSDLWHASFFIELFGVNSVFALSIISWTILFTNVVFGVIYLIEVCFSYKINSVSKLVLLATFAMLCLVLSGYSDFIGLRYKALIGDWYDYSLFSRPKQAMVILTLITAAIAIQRRRFEEFFFALMLGGILYLPLMPFFLVFSALALIYLKVLHPRLSILVSVSPILISCLFIFLFYLLFGGDEGHDSEGLGGLIDYYMNLASWRTAFNVFAGAMIKIVLALFLLVIPFYDKILKARWAIFKDELVTLTVIYLVSSALTYAVLHPLFDAVQIWALPYGSITPIMASMMLFPLLFLALPVWKKTYALVLIALILFQNIDKKPLRRAQGVVLDTEFYSNVIKEVESVDFELNTVFVRDSSEFGNIFTKMVDIYKPFDLFLYLDNNYFPLYLAPCHIPLEGSSFEMERQNLIISTNQFQKYVCAGNPDCGYDYPCETYQDEFIIDYGIKYLITSPKGEPNAEVKSMIKKTFTNSAGWSFHVLSPGGN